MSNLAGKDLKQILVFTLDEPRYALTLDAVERVVQAMEITRLPKAPVFVLGVINVQGQIIPVVDIRQRLHLPRRDLEVNDQFILARTSQRLVALVADSVAGIHELAERELVSAEQILPGAEYLHGLAKLEDDLVLICDLDQFLPFDEAWQPEAVLTEDVTQTGRPNGETA